MSPTAARARCVLRDAITVGGVTIRTAKAVALRGRWCFIACAVTARMRCSKSWTTIKRLSRPRLFTGVLLEDVPQPQDAWLGVMNPDNGQEAVLCSLGDGRVRAYLGYPRSAGHRLAKARDFPRFVEESVRTGVSPELYRNARVIGPMASFASADTWVEHPYCNGVALLGDAASTCAPPSDRDSQ